MKDTKKIKLNGESFELKKIPFRKNPEVAQLGTRIFYQGAVLMDDGSVDAVNIEDINEESLAGMILKIPALCTNVHEDFVNLLSVASDIDVEKINEFGYDDISELVMGILELNNIGVVIDNVKNSIGVFQKKAKKK
jgi:hypothetical protein